MYIGDMTHVYRRHDSCHFADLELKGNLKGVAGLVSHGTVKAGVGRLGVDVHDVEVPVLLQAGALGL
jgi:hypothetical protein